MTEVILLERVEKLGALGDVVHVKPGYARNYLLPQKIALRASKENRAYFEAQRAHIEAENAKKSKAAKGQAGELEDLTLTLVRSAGESGQLYGSVASRDIVEMVNENTSLTITRNQVDLNQTIKTLGLFPIRIILHAEVSEEITINVARSEEEAEMQLERGGAITGDIIEQEEIAAEEEAIAADAAAAEAKAAKAEADVAEDAAEDSEKVEEA